MDINRFTEKLQEAIRAAQSTAGRYGHQQIDVEHLLHALLEQQGGLAASILQKAEVNPDTIETRLEAELDRMPKVSGPAGDSRQSLCDAALQQAARARRRGRGPPTEGRIHLGGARAAGGARRPRRGGPSAAGVRPDPRAADAGAARSARQPARHLAESGGHLRSAGTVWPRSDQAWHRRASSIR